MNDINLDKELFKLAFENANIGMCLVDLNGNFFKVNAEMSNIFGYTIQELEKKNVNDITHPDYKEVSPKFIKQATNNELNHSVFEKHYLHKNGKEIVCIVTSSAVKNEFNETQFFISHVQDITVHKQVEIELKLAKERTEESEKIYRLIYEFNPMPMSIFDIETLNFLSVNNAFIDKYGYSREEFLNMTILDIRPETEKEKLKQTVWLPDKGVTNVGIYVHKKKNGEIMHVEIIRHELLFNNKKAKLVLVNDVTDKFKAEQNLLLINTELSIAKEKAEEGDGLKTAFLQNMSHEIRTPLNAISGFSGMLNKPELSEEKRKSFVSIIQNSSKQLVSIVTDILTISALETKQEKQSVDKVCINSIIVDLLAIFKQQSQNQNISLYAKQQLSDKQSEIYTDKTKITQILTNLLTNALKFTHEGFIEFGYNLRDSELEFYVKDSGIGIKPEFHEKIFERFRQADKSINKLYGGTGLGLAISKAFVELLGGKIWVQSELEKGSTFYFTIPYKPVNEIDKTTTPIKQNENFRTVLVAEDEEYNFLFIEELLIDLDLKLIHAKDGQETVEIFKSNPKIDLILMDIKMPIMTGHEAAKIIKELKPDLPIVAQSAYALEHERAKYEGIFDDYLTKPISENDLKEKVIKYIDKQINKWL